MPDVTIALADKPMRRLQEITDEDGIAPEELLRDSVEQWLVTSKLITLQDESKDDFIRAATYVLPKNHELYRRLA